MADGQNDREPELIQDGVSGEINLTDVMYVELGRTGTPPQLRTVAGNPKQWQPPKNESTPSNRTKKT